MKKKENMSRVMQETWKMRVKSEKAELCKEREHGSLEVSKCSMHLSQNNVCP